MTLKNPWFMLRPQHGRVHGPRGISGNDIPLYTSKSSHPTIMVQRNTPKKSEDQKDQGRRSTGRVMSRALYPKGAFFRTGKLCIGLTCPFFVKQVVLMMFWIYSLC